MRKKETFFTCGECGLAYQEKNWAQACEEFCRAHKSCSLEIIRHAVKRTADEKSEDFR